MGTSKATTNPLLTTVRWTARISSIPIIVVFLLMFFGEGFDPTKVKPIEWVMLLFGPFGFMLGMILGWWKEGLGGAITILSFLGAMLVGDYSGSSAGYMFICASPGLLFLLSWFLSKTAMVAENISVQSDPLPSRAEVLETRRTRIAEGQCPKCGAQVRLADQNCPSCRINLTFARENLGQW